MLFEYLIVYILKLNPKTTDFDRVLNKYNTIYKLKHTPKWESDLEPMILSSKNSSHIDSRYSDISSSKKPKFNLYLQIFLYVISITDFTTQKFPFEFLLKQWEFCKRFLQWHSKWNRHHEQWGSRNTLKFINQLKECIPCGRKWRRL